MIEVRESVDHKGWYIVQGGGKSAPTLRLLAEALRVPESELRFIPRAIERRGGKRDVRFLNEPDRIAQRTDFEVF